MNLIIKCFREKIDRVGKTTDIQCVHPMKANSLPEFERHPLQDKINPDILAKVLGQCL